MLLLVPLACLARKEHRATRLIAGIGQFLVEHGVSVSRGSPHRFKISFPLSEIGVDIHAVTEVECNGPVNLFERERWKGLRDALGGLPIEEGTDNRVQRNTTSGDPVTVVSLLNILPGHFAILPA